MGELYDEYLKTKQAGVKTIRTLPKREVTSLPTKTTVKDKINSVNQNKIKNGYELFNNATQDKSVISKLNQQRQEQMNNFVGPMQKKTVTPVQEKKNTSGIKKKNNISYMNNGTLEKRLGEVKNVYNTATNSKIKQDMGNIIKEIELEQQNRKEIATDAYKKVNRATAGIGIGGITEFTKPVKVFVENFKEDSMAREKALDKMGITNPIQRALYNIGDSTIDIGADTVNVGLNAINNISGKNFRLNGGGILEQDQYRKRTEGEVAQEINRLQDKAIKMYGGITDDGKVTNWKKAGQLYSSILQLLTAKTAGINNPTTMFATTGAVQSYGNEGTTESAVTGGVKGAITGKVFKTLSPFTQNISNKALSGMGLDTSTVANYVSNIIGTGGKYGISNAFSQVGDILKLDPNSQYIDYNEIQDKINKGELKTEEDIQKAISWQITYNRASEVGWSTLQGVVMETALGWNTAKATAYQNKLNNSLNKMSMEEIYKTLGINKNTTFEEAKAQYRKLAKLNHPDITKGSGETMTKINVAYDNLLKTKGWTTPVLNNNISTNANNNSNIVPINNQQSNNGIVAGISAINNVNTPKLLPQMQQNTPQTLQPQGIDSATNINVPKIDFSEQGNINTSLENGVNAQNDKVQNILPNEIRRLEDRLIGDKLLYTIDFINEIKNVGAKVDENGYVTVYHQTTSENAKKIIESGKMSAKEDGIFFSTSKNAQQSDGRGNAKLEFKIPAEKLILDDLFNDNADVRLPLKNKNEKIDVSKYLVKENIKYSKPTTEWGKYLKENWDLMPNSTKTPPNRTITPLPSRQEITTPPKKVDLAISEIANNPDGTKVLNMKENNKEIPVLSKKVENYKKSKRNKFITDLTNKLEVSKYANKELLQETTNEIIEKIQSKELTAEAKDKLFEKLYSKLIKIDDSYYNENKGLKNSIKKAKLYVSEELKNGITDYNNYRKSNLGNVTLTNDRSNISVDAFYQELNETNPYLFPDTIINEVDQLDRIIQVQKDMSKVETNLKAYNDGILGTEYKKWAKEDYNKVLNNLISDIEVSTAYENDRIEKETRKQNLKSEVVDTNTILDLYKQKTELQRKYDKEYKKELLTARDKVQLDRLVKGEITLGEVAKGTNINAISKLYKQKEVLNNIEEAIKLHKESVKTARNEKARELTSNASEWEDKNIGFLYSRETAERNIRDTVKNKQEADEVINTYFKPIHTREAERTRYINNIHGKIKSLDLSSKEKYKINDNILSKIMNSLEAGDSYTGQKRLSEQSLVQLLGEKIITKEDIEVLGADYNKIENGVKVYREIYNDLFTRANESLIRNGYAPVEFRKDYFPHFLEEKSDKMIDKVARRIGIETENQELQTNLAGLSYMFKPGKKWVANFLQRSKNETYFDAGKGLDNYLPAVTDVIFHTDNIQNLRALENEIRHKFSPDGIKEQIDAVYDIANLDDIQRQVLLEDIYKKDKSQLSHFATWLRRYTDIIAGKKSIGDRDMEYEFGRNAYTTMKNVQNKVTANMIVGNINSALTNFIPLVQASGEVTTESMMKAMWDTTRNAGRSDGFVINSDFLTNRRGAERITQTTSEKVAKTIGTPFEAIDEFTSETIVRAKYYDNLKNGMNEESAIDNANDFGASLLGDRSKGAKPILFEETNPIVKLFTAFQLEVNNQFSYMFKDLPKNVKEEVGNNIAKALFKILLGSWIYGELKEKLTGSRSITDPIDIVADIITDFKDKPTGEAVISSGKRIVQELPFIGGLFGGGRLPISAANPDFENLINSSIGLATGEMDSKKALFNITKELSKPASYLLLPYGGGQVKKIIEGASTIKKGGDYTVTSKGKKLRFPTGFDTMSKGEQIARTAQALIFGKYALPNGQKYIDSGFKSLSEKKTEQYEKLKDTGINSEQYNELDKKISSIESSKNESGEVISGSKLAKQSYIIMTSDLSEESKNKWISQLSDSDNPKTVSELSKIPKSEKAYISYFKMSDAQKKEVNNFIDLEIPFEKYSEFTEGVKNISYEKGKNGAKKEAVIKYINSIKNLNRTQKLILLKSYGNYKLSDTDKERIRVYINDNKKLTVQRKKEIWESLGY